MGVEGKIGRRLIRIAPRRSSALRRATRAQYRLELLTDSIQAYANAHSETESPVTARIPNLSRLIEMALDHLWRLPRLDQQFIAATTHYITAESSGHLSNIECASAAVGN